MIIMQRFFIIIFINIVSNLLIQKYYDKSVNINHIVDPIARSVEQHKNHPSIVAIKSKSTNISNLTVFQRQKLSRIY